MDVKDFNELGIVKYKEDKDFKNSENMCMNIQNMLELTLEEANPKITITEKSGRKNVKLSKKYKTLINQKRKRYRFLKQNGFDIKNDPFLKSTLEESDQKRF